jgi:hypothetical protein
MIATAFGPLIGGISTPAGTAANLVAIAQLKPLAHVDVSFWRWMQLGVPASLLMIPFAWAILLRLFPPEIDRLLDQRRIRPRAPAGAGIVAPGRGPDAARVWGRPGDVADHAAARPVDGGRIAPPVEAVARRAASRSFCPGCEC